MCERQELAAERISRYPPSLIAQQLGDEPERHPHEQRGPAERRWTMPSWRWKRSTLALRCITAPGFLELRLRACHWLAGRPLESFVPPIAMIVVSVVARIAASREDTGIQSESSGTASPGRGIPRLSSARHHAHDAATACSRGPASASSSNGGGTSERDKAGFARAARSQSRTSPRCAKWRIAR